MTRIILVRHGQTVWNIELKYQGHADIDLSSVGIEQADQVAARLAGLKPAAIYSSDLTRLSNSGNYCCQTWIAGC